MNVKQLLFSLILLCSAPLAASNIIYVSTLGTVSNSGASWNATVTLASACNMAKQGDQIWVAQGIHTPGNERTSTFNIPAGVKVYGGFDGTEADLSQRQVEANKTVLSGNIGTPAANDNCYTVVTMNNANGGTLLDGFVVEGGEAMDRSRSFTVATTGGALFISGGVNEQGPLIKNCTFTNNQARNGGAVFVDGSKSGVRPHFVNCIFRTNKASFKGGAVFNNGENGKANTIFTDCLFEQNRADLGGCLLNQGTSGMSNPLINNSKFNNNSALTDGAVIYNIVQGNGETAQIMNNCEMRDNDSYLGNDIGSNYQVRQQNNPAAPQKTSGGTLHSVN